MIQLNEDEINNLKINGYIIIKNFYTTTNIIKMRNIIIDRMINKKNMLNLGNNSGSKPDFLRDPMFKDLIPLLRLNDIHNIMKSIFNAPFHLCYHNDIGINRIVNWHKDTLNNQYKIYQKKNIWLEHEGEKHEIYKFLIYLQDHSNNNDGLQLIEKSHLNPIIDLADRNKKYINSNLGDVVIFDQRITHRGSSSENYNYDRVLISLGFGKNNIFTKEFEEGTIRRQNDQNRTIVMKNNYF